jgi:hypothetical protein
MEEHASITLHRGVGSTTHSTTFFDAASCDATGTAQVNHARELQQLPTSLRELI